jgi:predicted ATPase
LHWLDTCLAEALAGRGRVVFVTGEAGTGKTALIQEFARRAEAEHADLVVATGHCRAFTGIGDPYLPFREILGLLTGDVRSRWAAGALDPEGARRLWALIPHAVRALVEASPDLIDAFVVSQALFDRARAAAPGGARWLAGLEERLAGGGPSRANLRQTDLFEQYATLLTALAGHRPLLLILDDLQWADAGSASLLFHLGQRLAGTRILIAGCYRPSEVALRRESPLTACPSAGEASRPRSGPPQRHPLQPVIHEFQRQFGQVEVALGQTGDRRFVEAFLDSEPNRLDATFRQRLYERTQGHALYTVEMVRDMRESGALAQDKSGSWVEGAAIDWASLPARVEGAIGERIDRLPAALRETLQVASVEGETFTAEVVAQVQGVSEREVVRQLSGELDRWHRLVVSVGSHRSLPGGQQTSRYRFRHILFQEYVYQGLDEAERAYLHKAVGDALEQRFDGRTEAIAIQLAQHYRLAELETKAIDYLHQAGEQALRSCAYQEAILVLDHALALVARLPDGTERAQRELALLLAQGNALIGTKGFGDPQVERAYARAREMCWQVGETPQLFPALFGLCVYYGTRAEMEVARELVEQLWHLAQRTGDRNLVLQAHHTWWSYYFAVGEHTLARSHVEQGLALYVPQHHRSHVYRYAGHDARVCGLAWGGPALWCLGYPDQALDSNREALAFARELSHPVTLALALKWLATLYQLRREEQATFKWAEEAVAFASEQRLALWQGWSDPLRGWALARQGQGKAGLAQIRQGLATYQATGAALDLPYILALLAESYGSVGQTDEGLETVDEALATAHRTGERYYEAELNRLKGELLLAQSEGAAVAQVEASFCRAIEVARRQSARSLELRATTSLCKLWQKQGKTQQAHRRLAQLYDWFTEGFDTVDLQEARRLLEELA